MYHFVTSCVSALGEDIIEMVDIAGMGENVESVVDFNDMKKILGDRLTEFAEMVGCDLEFLENDYHVNYEQSHYQGLPCYYIKHSGIEHVYVHSDYMSDILDSDNARARHDMADSFEESIDKPWELIKERNIVPNNFESLFASNPGTVLKALLMTSETKEEFDDDLDSYRVTEQRKYTGYGKLTDTIKFLYENCDDEQFNKNLDDKKNKLIESIESLIPEYMIENNSPSSSEKAKSFELVKSNLELFEFMLIEDEYNTIGIGDEHLSWIGKSVESLRNTQETELSPNEY